MNPNADEPPPVQFPHPVNVHSSTFGLFILYILITIVALFQIIRILCYRHNLLHYQFFFLALSLLWSVIRAIFWIMTPWSPFLEVAMQGWAIWAQFAMFSFLVLFYIQVVYKAEGWWTTYRVRIFVVYASIVTLFFFGYVTILVLSIEFGSASPTIDKINFGFVGLMFLLLSASLTVYTVKMWQLKSSIKPQLPPSRTKMHILLITILLVAIFMSRTVKSVISIFGIGAIGFEMEMKPGVQAIIFFMYFAWEVLPISMVILLFWNIPHTQTLRWGPFTAPYGNDFPNLAYAYDSDIRTRGINDGSTTDDTIIGWDNISRSVYADVPVSSAIDDYYDDAAVPIISTPGSFPGSLGTSKLTPYNTKSPLLTSRH